MKSNTVTFTRRKNAPDGEWRMSTDGRCDAETSFLIAVAATQMAAEMFGMSPKAIARDVVEYINGDKKFFHKK